MRKIPFSPPDITEREIELVTEALRSGWITTGPKTKEFERKIAEYCGNSSGKAVCLNSATACMEMALRLLGVGEGDEVITCAYTYTASASVAYHVGAKIVLVDVASGGFHIDYEKLSDAITEKTKAIIPVDIAGVMCDYDKILDIVKSKSYLFKPNSEIQKAMGRIAVISDCAHGFGAEFKGKKAGACADLTSFSFHAVKNLTTAEGGALVWNTIEGISDDEIYRQLMLLSLHGQSKDALAKTKLGAWEYDITYPAYKCNMTDIAASIGLVQLERYCEMLAKRKKLIEIYNKELAGIVEFLPHYTEDYLSSGHLYLINLTGKTLEERNEFIIKMAESGVACNVHYKPLPMLSAYKNLGFDIADFPNAYAKFVNEVSLPLNSKMSEDDAYYVCQKVKEILGE